MRLRTAITAGALVLAPALALAAQPILVSLDGQVIPAHETTRIIQTSAGPARVSTWSWHSPNGNASFVVQSSTGGGAPPAWALRQMRDMQTQMAMMQAQMQQLDEATFTAPLGMPAPLSAMFAVPAWTVVPVPEAVVLVPAPHARAPSQPAHSPGVKI